MMTSGASVLLLLCRVYYTYLKLYDDCNNMSTLTKTILTIDGGGMRGIIPAMFLHYLHSKLAEHNPGKELHNYFDMIAGTSTGGLIALGLSTPLVATGQTSLPKYSTESLIKLYTQKGEKIFSKQGSKLRKRITPIFKAKYSHSYLSSLMEELYGEARMSQAFLPVVITAFDAMRMQPHLFTSHPSPYNRYGQTDFYIKDAARSTSAAPVYFSPAKVKSVGSHAMEYNMVDGGIYANNPSLLAVTEAKRLFPEAKKFRLVSIGTGISNEGYSHDEMNTWGAAQWLSLRRSMPILNIMMTANSSMVDHSLKSMPEVDYLRFNVRLDPKRKAIDNVSSSFIQYLEKRSIAMIKENKVEVEGLIKNLLKKV